MSVRNTVKSIQDIMRQASASMATRSAFHNCAGCSSSRSSRHRGGATELARFAGIYRVTRVMQPYLDATV